jgi:hypothetical protein
MEPSEPAGEIVANESPIYKVLGRNGPTRGLVRQQLVSGLQLSGVAGAQRSHLVVAAGLLRSDQMTAGSSPVARS